jgi:hypothetical protein
LSIEKKRRDRNFGNGSFENAGFLLSNCHVGIVPTKPMQHFHSRVDHRVRRAFMAAAGELVSTGELVRWIWPRLSRNRPIHYHREKLAAAEIADRVGLERRCGRVVLAGYGGSNQTAAENYRGEAAANASNISGLGGKYHGAEGIGKRAGSACEAGRQEMALIFSL